MALYRRKNSSAYWYDFTVDGKRYRGSTETSKITQARAYESSLISKAKESGSDAVRPVCAPATERTLLEGLETPVNHGRTQRLREQIRDFLVIAQDTGMRPKEILRMRIEHIDWDNRRIWNPHGKTAKSRRFVPMSHRMKDVLEARCGKQKDGWVFPSDRSKSGHLNSIAVGFRALRERVGVSNKIVPYSARHTYGSFTMEATGNIFAVADSMGHVDVQSMKPYQHPRLEPLREVIDRRNEANGSRHVLRHTGEKQPGI